MRTLIPDLDELRQFLSYNEETGDLFWTRDRPPAVKAGQLAGSRHHRDSTWYVVFNGHRYAAHHLAWFLKTGQWPRHRIGFRDGNHDNTAWRNLISATDRYSQRPQAVAWRARNKRLAEIRSTLSLAEAEAIAYRGISYKQDTGLWELRVKGNKYDGVLIAKATNREELEQLADERGRIAGFLFEHPYAPQRTDPTLLSGRDPNAPTYREIASMVAYDPATGGFYRRHDKVQLRADTVNASGRRIVSFMGRSYSVGMLAWFLTHREWPKPKSIGFRDNDPSNAALANLYKIRRPQ